MSTIVYSSKGYIDIVKQCYLLSMARAVEEIKKLPDYDTTGEVMLSLIITGVIMFCCYTMLQWVITDMHGMIPHQMLSILLSHVSLAGNMYLYMLYNTYVNMCIVLVFTQQLDVQLCHGQNTYVHRQENLLVQKWCYLTSLIKVT